MVGMCAISIWKLGAKCAFAVRIGLWQFEKNVPISITGKKVHHVSATEFIVNISWKNWKKLWIRSQIKFLLFMKRERGEIRDVVNARQMRKKLTSQRKAGRHELNTCPSGVCQDQCRLCGTIHFLDLKNVAGKSMSCALKKHKFPEFFLCLKGN